MEHPSSEDVTVVKSITRAFHLDFEKILGAIGAGENQL